MISGRYISFRKEIFLLITGMIISSSCSQQTDEQKIINKSIDFYGMQQLENASVTFDFRQYQFKVSQQNGNHRYERFFTDSAGSKVHDLLTKNGLVREVDNRVVKLSGKENAAYSEAVNAAVYFVYLPLKLNDSAVQKKLLGQVKIKGKEYYKLEISFSRQDGGKDYDDIYYYWFDTADYSMDYFAYSTGGKRFRQVSELHDAEGIRFQDYVNYEHPKNDSLTPLIKYDSLYQSGKLVELSRIELKNIQIILTD